MTSDPTRIHTLVSLCCQKLELPANQVWDMSVADIGLTLKEHDNGWSDSKDAGTQMVLCLLLDERIQLMKSLTLDERVELAKWKSELM